MTVDLTEEEVKCILALLDQAPCKGRKVRDAMSVLEAKLEDALKPKVEEIVSG